MQSIHYLNYLMIVHANRNDVIALVKSYEVPNVIDAVVKHEGENIDVGSTSVQLALSEWLRLIRS